MKLLDMITLLAENSVCHQKLLLEAKRKLGEILSAFEFLDHGAMDLVSFMCLFNPSSLT